MRKLIRFALKECRQERPYFNLHLAMLALLALSRIIYSHVIGVLSDSAIELNLENCLIYAVMVLLVIVFQALLEYYDAKTSEYAKHRIRRSIRAVLLKRLHTADAETLRSMNKGNTTSVLINASSQMASLLMGSFPALVYDFVFIGLAFFYVCSLHFILAISYFLTVPAVVWIQWKATQAVGICNRAVQDAQAELDDFTNVLVNNHELIFVHEAGKTVKRWYEEQLAKYKDRFRRLMYTIYTRYPAGSILSIVPMCVSLAVAAFLISGQYIGVGDAIGFIVLSGMSDRMLFSIMNHFMAAKQDAAGAHRVEELYSVEQQTDGLTEDPSDTRGELLQVEDVCVSYRGKAVLKDVSFVARKGEIIVLTGVSGAGKSTLLRVLAREVCPQAGRVLLDGKDINGYGVQDYRSIVNYVESDPHVFSMTVRENIDIANTQATDEAREKACDAAQIPQSFLARDEAIVRMGDVSGGERQRIALARSFLRNPAVVYLYDEPLSALDAETKEKIVEHIVSRKDAISIISTHDRRMMERADRLFVLNDGVLQEMPGGLDNA